MGVVLRNIPTYYCTCDICGTMAKVEKNIKLYNGAQAVRSLHWSFGKDGSVKCNVCRKREWNDHYQYR